MDIMKDEKFLAKAARAANIVLGAARTLCVIAFF